MTAIDVIADRLDRLIDELIDIKLKVIPQGCEEWHVVVVENHLEKATAQWLWDRRAVFENIFSDVYWIKDAMVAVEFKLRFA